MSKSAKKRKNETKEPKAAAATAPAASASAGAAAAAELDVTPVIQFLASTPAIEVGSKLVLTDEGKKGVETFIAFITRVNNLMVQQHGIVCINPNAVQYLQAVAEMLGVTKKNIILLG